MQGLLLHGDFFVCELNLVRFETASYMTTYSSCRDECLVIIRNPLAHPAKMP
jgi:hypothetical protein